MSTKKKVLKVILWVVAIILALVILLVAGAYSYFRFVISKKLSDNSENPVDDGITFSDLAKDFTDKQIISNIINFDKNSASDMLAALNELEEEAENNESADDKTAEDGGSKSGNNDKKSSETSGDKKSENNTAAEPEPQVQVEGKTAYQRIMNTATKEEISQGISIISKIDMAKVNELRSQGNISAIKAYVKNTLTSSEISKALALYKKYKHLL